MTFKIAISIYHNLYKMYEDNLKTLMNKINQLNE